MTGFFKKKYKPAPLKRDYTVWSKLGLSYRCFFSLICSFIFLPSGLGTISLAVSLSSSPTSDHYLH